MACKKGLANYLNLIFNTNFNILSANVGTTNGAEMRNLHYFGLSSIFQSCSWREHLSNFYIM